MGVSRRLQAECSAAVPMQPVEVSDRTSGSLDEKNSVVGVIESTCEEYRVPIRPLRGQDSSHFAYGTLPNPSGQERRSRCLSTTLVTMMQRGTQSNNRHVRG